jgi:hypothetical protein
MPEFTEADVERVAQAMYAPDHPYPWSDQNDHVQGHWRRLASTALAALSATPEPGEPRAITELTTVDEDVALVRSCELGYAKCPPCQARLARLLAENERLRAIEAAARAVYFVFGEGPVESVIHRNDLADLGSALATSEGGAS